MNRIIKKVLASFLAVLMVCTMLPFTAFATVYDPKLKPTMYATYNDCGLTADTGTSATGFAFDAGVYNAPVDPKGLKKGDAVSITFWMTGITTLSAVQAEISYNKDYLAPLYVNATGSRKNWNYTLSDTAAEANSTEITTPTDSANTYFNEAGVNEIADESQSDSTVERSYAPHIQISTYGYAIKMADVSGGIDAEYGYDASKDDWSEGSIHYDDCLIATFVFYVKADTASADSLVDMIKSDNTFYLADATDGAKNANCYFPCEVTDGHSNQFFWSATKPGADVPTDVVYTFADGSIQTVTDGSTPDNTATKYTYKADNKHTKTVYSWQAEGTNFKEVGADSEEACSYDDGVVTKDATATEAGIKTYTCSICGHQYTEAIPALGVVYTFANGSTQTVKDGSTPDNTATKYVYKADSKHTKTVYGWIADGANFKEVGTDTEEACSFDSGVVTKDATATEDGIKTYTCTLCGHQYTEAIPALGVVYTFADGSTQTITNGSTPANSATVYDDKDNGTHDKTTYAWVADGVNFKEKGTTTNEACAFGNWTTVQEPTCTVAGSKQRTCANCGYVETASIDATGHSYDAGVVTTQPTYKDAGVKTFTCSVCGDTYTEPVAALGCDVTVKAAATGTVTFNGDTVTTDKTKKVAYGNTFSMTAEPAVGETFIGWAIGNKIVSTDTTFNGTAYAPSVVYTPVFDKAAATQITATFLDPYSNIVDTYTAADFSALTLPEAPVFSGYTFKGWSMSLEDIKASTESVTVVAEYEKDAVTGYTVTVPEGVNVEGTKIEGTDTYAYDTKVTVSQTGAKAWKITGTDKVVGYGESYTFYVGANISLTPVMAETEAVPTVNMVSAAKFAGSQVVAFNATRTISSGYKFIRAGFVYGKNMNDADLVIEKAGQTGTGVGSGAVKVIYAKDIAKDGQFQLNYGCASTSAKPCAKAFIVYANADGSNVKVVYTDMVAFDYNV